MPLKKSASKKAISENIEEFHKGETYAKTKARQRKKQADKQAVAVALSMARKAGARIPKKKKS